MFVRKALTGAVTLAVTGSVLALTTGAANAADPDDTTFTPTTADVVGVGSDTSQNALLRLANSYNATVPAGGARLASFAATGGGTIPLPTAAVNRPNGSGAGKATLYGSANNTDIDFARSSSTLSTAEISAGLQQFPFALDTLKTVVSSSVPSNAPASLTAAQLVSIYKGETTNWNQVGGSAGVIEAKIPQAGSGTRSFFVAQLTAANGGAAVTFGPNVAEVQENDPAPIQNNPNAVAPYSAGRAALTPSALRVQGGFQADRALYNVVRNDDLGKAPIQAIFGSNGYLCSDDAIDEIEAAGFEQLDSVNDGGVCGSATQAATTNFQLNEPVVAIPTTTTVSGTSPSAKALRLTAKVTGTTTPTGTVTFINRATDSALGTANLIGGTAILNLSNRAPGVYSIEALYNPTADSAFVVSNGVRSVRVKAASSITESFATTISRTASSAKGTVAVVYSGLANKPTGKIAIREGSKLVGSGTLNSAGKVSVTLSKRTVGTGRSKLTITYPGDTLGFGSSRSFYITFNK